MHTPDPDNHIPEELRKLRSVRRWVFGLFAGFIPFALISSLVLESLHLSPLWALGPYGLAYGLLCIWLGYSPCPRCGKLFYRRGIFISPFWTHCGSCSLELPD